MGKLRILNRFLVEQNTEGNICIEKFFGICLFIYLFLQLTLEQQGFELRWSTSTGIFFDKYILEHYTTCGWLNLWIRNRGYRGTAGTEGSNL